MIYQRWYQIYVGLFKLLQVDEYTQKHKLFQKFFKNNKQKL